MTGAVVAAVAVVVAVGEAVVYDGWHPGGSSLEH